MQMEHTEQSLCRRADPSCVLQVVLLQGAGHATSGAALQNQEGNATCCAVCDHVLP